MFHVKHPVHRMNEEMLLTYTEIPKNHIQYIFDIDPSKQSPQGISRPP